MEQATNSARVGSASRGHDGRALLHLNRPPANRHAAGFTADPKAGGGLGIVDRLLTADRLLHEAIAFGATMAGGPTLAIGEIKLAAKQGLEMPLESALALERGGIFRLFETADAKEGLNAFV